MKFIPVVLIVVHLISLIVNSRNEFHFPANDHSVFVLNNGKVIASENRNGNQIQAMELSGIHAEQQSDSVFLIKRNIGQPILIDILLIAIYGLILALYAERKKRETPDENQVFVAYEKCEISASPNKVASTDFERLVQFLSVEYKNPLLSLEFVEQSLTMPLHRIRALLKDNNKMNFKQYVTELRITESKRLLLIDNYRVQDVALAVGYTHTTTFNHVFKDCTGQTPRAFREENGMGTPNFLPICPLEVAC